MALEEEFLKLSGTNYWLAEFTSLYGDFNEYDFTEDYETLEQWYDETYEKYKNDRGVKQNPLIGSDVDTIISSNYTINYQVEATKDYIENIYAELGIDMTVDDFIAKNALMAEYMMQNSNFDNVLKDYNVSIKFVVDNLQRGTFEEKNGTTVVLSDFQTIEFDDTIEKVGSLDKDNDTLTNKAELGDTKWQDITGFVEKMYIFKYGTNMTMYESKVDEMVINNGGYTDFNGNFVYGHVKKEKDLSGNIKVFYRVYDYKSNPILKDTDFDGMDDNADGRPKDNNFKGMAKIERNQNLKVDYHNDYRHFYIDNNKYNSELAEMSLMISNLANDEERELNIYQGGIQVGMINTGGVLIGDMTIEDYLEKIGFISLATMSLSNGKAYLSYKIVNYYGKEKLIFGIFIGGFDDEESYIKFITDTNNMHQKYEEVVNSIFNKIKDLQNMDLIKQYINSQNYCYFITGKGIAGAVAAEVATKLGDTHNIYCYTFGMPNIKSSPTLLYIKNIVNEDDLLTKIHSDIGQDGDVYNKSIYWDLIQEYRHYVESPNRYKGNYKKTNAIRDNIEDIKRSMGWSYETREIFMRELSEYLYSQIGGGIITLHDEIFHDSRDYSNANNEIEERLVEIEEFTDSLTTANSTKAYWCLVKVLDGYDSKYYYGNEENRTYDDKIQGMTGTQDIIQTDEDKELDDPRNGYRFNMKKDYEITNRGYNNSNEETVRIKDFMYSNYTLKCDSPDDYKDVNYVKFWYEGNRNIPKNKNGEVEKLYLYKAGDISESTKCSYGSEKNANSGSWTYKYIKNYTNNGGNVDISLNNSLPNDMGLLTINNRILAAFPAAVFSEDFSNNSQFTQSTEKMNLWDRYKIEETTADNKGGGTYFGHMIEGQPYDMYKLIDVVIEDENSQQFVVPFICIDAKSVHFLPNYPNNEEQYYNGISKKGMYSTLTDNRYGQVMEYIENSSPTQYTYYYYSANYLGLNMWFNEKQHEDAMGDLVAFTYLNKKITYYNRNENRKVSYVSPIEPYIYNKQGINTYSDILTAIICGKNNPTTGNKLNYRIVSIRVYNERCAEDDGTPITGTWEERQKEINNNTIKKINEYGNINEYLKSKYKDIVKYK